jgi:hypothetical protein
MAGALGSRRHCTRNSALNSAGGSGKLNGRRLRKLTTPFWLERATPPATHTQPLDQEWNPSGYGWNVVPRVGLDVVKQLSAASQPAPPPSSNLPQPAALKGLCAVFHDDDVIRQQRLTCAQWDREINKMAGWGAKVKDEDRAGLLDYLFTNYGPRPRNR